ncbi:MAG: hypothetical protein SWO11_22295 [Thermodesulfobacteriota bacterium]|nr:hypothetical protein [Thermodesulfobacteriota bacterium]
MKSFRISENGWASRIGRQFNEKFGGRRICPYYIKTRPNGYQGKETFELIFHIEKIFFDKDGKPTDLKKADSIKEKFKSL